MKRERNAKQAFIEGTVRVVARDGLDKTTTKAIATEAGLSEAYIYRCFESKEALLCAAFHMEDVAFAYFLKQTSWACIYRMLHGRTERFNCGQQAGGSFLEGRTTASFTFDTTILRIAALMHTRSISNVFRSYLQRWNRLSNRKPMSTCYFIRFLTRCCLLPQECLAAKCRMMMRPRSGHLNRYTALLYLTFVKSF